LPPIRQVTLDISTTCSTPQGHQPGYLQFSVDETWIPPFPLRFPLSGEGITEELDSVVAEVHYWLRAAENSRNTGVGHVGDIGETGPELRVKGSTASKSITLWARNEIDLCTSKDEPSTNSPQIALHAQVEPAEIPQAEEGGPQFEVKVHGRYDLLDAGRSTRLFPGGIRDPLFGPLIPPSGGWPGAPGEVPHRPIPLKPDEGLQISTRENDAWKFRRDKDGRKRRTGRQGIPVLWGIEKAKGVRVVKRLPKWRKPRPFWWWPWWYERYSTAPWTAHGAVQNGILVLDQDGLSFEMDGSLRFDSSVALAQLSASQLQHANPPDWMEPIHRAFSGRASSRERIEFTPGDWQGHPEIRRRPIRAGALASQVPTFTGTADASASSDIVELRSPTAQGPRQSPTATKRISSREPSASGDDGLASGGSIESGEGTVRVAPSRPNSRHEGGSG